MPKDLGVGASARRGSLADEVALELPTDDSDDSR
jgi:hypothetical protein